MRIGLLLLCCGCRQLLGFEDVAAVDGTPANDAGDGSEIRCVGAMNGLLPQTCIDPVPPAVILDDRVINTDGVCDPSRSDVCIVAAQKIEIVGTVGARGSRPLVLWSASTITLSDTATLDLHSSGLTIIGAGANDLTCMPGDGGAGVLTDPQIGSGGCGGSFGGNGGASGAGASSNAIVSTECEQPATTLDRVRGGCRGGHGGLSDAVGSLNGGNSGGAVYLMAFDSIEISGAIDARGGAGRAAFGNGSRMAGGGGGGSGGLIGLDAPSLMLDGATLIAVGSGGSSGVGKNAITVIQGNAGKDATLGPPFFASTSGETVASNFGGASAETGGDVNTGNTGGGGGGGGGDGFIVAFTATPPSLENAQVAPLLRVR